MPGLMPASSITSSASPRRSRASSVEKVPPTIGATSRWAAGNLGSVGCARHEAIASASIAAMMAVLFDSFDHDGFARDALRQGGGHEAVEIAVEDVAGRGRGDA